MAKMADLKKQGRSWLVSAALIAVGALVGYALPQNTASPASDIGTVTSVSPASGGAGTELVFKPKVGARQSFRIDDSTPWQGKPSGTWNTTGRPPCLVPGSAKPNHVTLGVVNVHAVGSAPGATIVAWIECYA